MLILDGQLLINGNPMAAQGAPMPTVMPIQQGPNAFSGGTYGYGFPYQPFVWGAAAGAYALNPYNGWYS